MAERGQRAIGTIRHPRPEHIVDRVGADAGRQAGHFAIPEVPGHAEPVAHVGGSRSAKTLAVRSTGIKPEVLITPKNFGLGVILSPDWYHHHKDKYSKNQ